MKKNISKDAVIIGAGPAGLCTGICAALSAERFIMEEMEERV